MALDKKEMLKTRDEFIELIKKELLGPGSEVSVPDAEHEGYSVPYLFVILPHQKNDIQ